MATTSPINSRSLPTKRQWRQRMQAAERAAGATHELTSFIRFYAHIAEDQYAQPESCWEWQGARNSRGYGRAHRAGHDGAHRVSWLLTNGPVPAGLQVCHHCDNPPCINPAHLFLGTPSENHLDRRDKGRLRGIKLDRTKVLEIRAALAKGELQSVVADLYGVKVGTIGAIAQGANWGDVR